MDGTGILEALMLATACTNIRKAIVNMFPLLHDYCMRCDKNLIKEAEVYKEWMISQFDAELAKRI